MGYKNTLLSLANKLAPLGFFLSARLPTYYQGHWIWLSQESWGSFFSREEAPVGKSIRAHLRTGDTFCDIGAHIGWFSLLASKLVGSKGKIFSFEPAPEVFELLSINTRGLTSIRAIQCAVGNVDGRATFAAQGTSTSASLVEDITRINQHYLPQTPIRKVEVDIRRMDTLVTELGFKPCLAKIDVEGFELEVLKGASTLLSSSRPTLIIEIHPLQLKLSGGSEPVLFQFLKEHGYGWEVIDRNPNSTYSIVAKPNESYCKPAIA
jgi:FkbM family methyltransferase